MLKILFLNKSFETSLRDEPSEIVNVTSLLGFTKAYTSFITDMRANDIKTDKTAIGRITASVRLVLSFKSSYHLAISNYLIISDIMTVIM